MDVKIDKSSVTDDVVMSVSIIARSIVDSNGGSLYDKVRIQERDKELIAKYIGSAIGNVLKELNNFIASYKNDTLTLVENRRFNEAVVSDLSGIVHQYLMNFVSAEWMKIKAVEYAPVFSARADECLNTIFAKLRFKNEPVMKTFDS